MKTKPKPQQANRAPTLHNSTRSSANQTTINHNPHEQQRPKQHRFPNRTLQNPASYHPVVSNIKNSNLQQVQVADSQPHQFEPSNLLRTQFLHPSNPTHRSKLRIPLEESLRSLSCLTLSGEAIERKNGAAPPFDGELLQSRTGRTTRFPTTLA